MNARIQLTDRERALCRQTVFMEKRQNKRFTLEALGECDDSWHKAHINAESLELHRAIDQAVWNYCESCGLFAEAERDLLAGIEISGGRVLA